MKKIKTFIQKIEKHALMMMALIALTILKAKAQAGGAAGIDAASSELATYLDPISNLALAIGALVGFIGGIRVFIKWNSGDQDVQKAIMGWFGSCLFLVTIGIVIKAFF